jgi:hypothetical protein
MIEQAGRPSPRRNGKPRDRHGRGSRGPFVLAGPLAASAPRDKPRRDRFDELVLSLVNRHLKRWGEELGDVEFGTEDVPALPDDWEDDVPFGALVKGGPGEPTRIVVFRRPVEMRASTRVEQLSLVGEILIEQIAELLGRDPGEFSQP